LKKFGDFALDANRFIWVGRVFLKFAKFGKFSVALEGGDLIEHLRCYGLFVFRITAFAFSSSLSSMVKQAIRPTNGKIKN
jgi:hypothetical protein